MPQKQRLQSLEVVGNAVFHGSVQMKNKPDADAQWKSLSSRLDSLADTVAISYFSQSELESVTKDASDAKIAGANAQKRAESSEKGVEVAVKTGVEASKRAEAAEKASAEASKRAQAAERASDEASRRAEAAEKASAETSKRADAADKSISELKKQLELLQQAKNDKK